VHATGAAATVHLDWRDDLRVTVSDTGGRSPARRPVGGHGLTGVRERVAACGGTVDAEATADGFRVHARIPVPG